MRIKKPDVDVGSELIEGMENAAAHARGRNRVARETVVRARVPKKVDGTALPHRSAKGEATSDLTLEQIKEAVLAALKEVGDQFAKGLSPTDGTVRAALEIAARKPQGTAAPKKQKSRRKSVSPS